MNQDPIRKIIKEKAQSHWWLESEKKVVGKYGQIFHPINLSRLTKEDFQSFLLFRNNLHWWGIHRQQESITTDMRRLKQTLTVLFDESYSLRERLDSLSPKKGENYVKGVGKAIITPILLVVYADK